MALFHYTDKPAWNAIRSQTDWLFKASQPKASERPVGAYFTDLEPSETNLRLLHKKLRVPKENQEYVFMFNGSEGLDQLNEGRGRDKHIIFSAVDYAVVKPRQGYSGISCEWIGREP